MSLWHRLINYSEFVHVAFGNRASYFVITRTCSRRKQKISPNEKKNTFNYADDLKSIYSREKKMFNHKPMRN